MKAGNSVPPTELLCSSYSCFLCPSFSAQPHLFSVGLNTPSETSLELTTVLICFLPTGVLTDTFSGLKALHRTFPWGGFCSTITSYSFRVTNQLPNNQQFWSGQVSSVRNHPGPAGSPSSAYLLFLYCISLDNLIFALSESCCLSSYPSLHLCPSLESKHFVQVQDTSFTFFLFTSYILWLWKIGKFFHFLIVYFLLIYF